MSAINHKPCASNKLEEVKFTAMGSTNAAPPVWVVLTKETSIMILMILMIQAEAEKWDSSTHPVGHLCMLERFPTF